MTAIRLDAVSKSFGPDGGPKRSVLAGVSTTIRADRFTALFGPNGCGKTTFLNLIAGIVAPDTGSVLWSEQDAAPRQIGYAWQDFRSSLLPWLSVAENVAFPLRARGVARRERMEQASELLASFLPEVEERGRCYQLSGGQQQLLCLLRAVISGPDVLLLDEPFAALDAQRSWEVALYLEQLWFRRPVPVVFVSHEIDEAVLLADDILLLSKASGTISRIVENRLPRPRTLAMLTATEHTRCRNEVIDFLLEEKASQNGTSERRASRWISAGMA